MYSLLVNQICPPQQEVTQMINWVSRCFLAQFNKSFSQMRYYIIHQILSDWLRPCIKQISFLLPNEFQLRLFLFFSLLSASFILQLLLLSKDLLFFSLFFFLFLESYLSYNLVFFRIWCCNLQFTFFLVSRRLRWRNFLLFKTTQELLVGVCYQI